MKRLLLLIALLVPLTVSAQTTITIPQDPAIAGLQAQVQTLTQLQAQVQTLTQQVRALTVPADSPAFVAAVTQWKANMLTYGTRIAAGLTDPGPPAAVQQEAVYYDGTWVFLQIEQLTGAAAWHAAALSAHHWYRTYLDPQQGKAAAYDMFPHGLFLLGDFDTLKAMALGSAFAGSYPLEWTISADSSREVAYNVQSKLMAVSVGQPVWGLDEQAQQMFGHVAQWSTLLNGQPVTTMPTGYAPPTYVRPFMAALTSLAMIEWAGTDPTRLKQVVDTLTPFWSLLWGKCFLAQQPVMNNPGVGLVDTMMYTNMVAADGSGGQDPAPDLNLLIAPVLGWLYAQTHDLAWREKHDRLFVGGVAGAYLGNGKQFNQSYQRSFQGLRWRSE